MDLYWIYNLPNWQFFLLTITFFVGFSLLGAFAFSSRLEKWMGITAEHNATVSTFLSLSSVFYGITLGLIAVATFENFKQAEDKVTNESSSLAALYRDVTILEKPEKKILTTTLKEYTRYIVTQAWPLQQKGIVPKGGTQLMDTFQLQLAAYTPDTEKDKIIYAQVFSQFNGLIEKRRLRLNAVTSGLPASVWMVLFLGAFINTVLTWLLVIKNKKLDIAVNSLNGLLLGSLIFLIAAMDNPFRGEFSVTADSFQLLLDGLMK